MRDFGTTPHDEIRAGFEAKDDQPWWMGFDLTAEDVVLITLSLKIAANRAYENDWDDAGDFVNLRLAILAALGIKEG